MPKERFVRNPEEHVLIEKSVIAANNVREGLCELARIRMEELGFSMEVLGYTSANNNNDRENN